MAFRLCARFSFRRTVLLGSAFAMFWIFVFSLAPITSPLPPYTGPHDVGVLDVETEVKRQVIHPATLKETGEKAFELRTLAVTLYYPSHPVTAPGTSQPLARPWLPQPISLIGTGYARIIGIMWPPAQSLITGLLWLFGSKTVIPGIVDGPVLPAHKDIFLGSNADVPDIGKIIEDAVKDEKTDSEHLEVRNTNLWDGKLPCVVFTHGMAGMSQSYSHYLGSIASHGIVVAAVEHRDGSGPGSIVHHPDANQTFSWHVKLEDMVSDPPMTEYDLKVAQLAFREAEMVETVNLFRRLHAGEGKDIVNLKPDSPETALPGFKGRLDLSAVTVIGHSYGATGALQALKRARSDDFPLNGGVALDPGKSSGPLNFDIDVPTLILQSGEWTEKHLDADFYGQGKHWEVVKKLAKSVKKAWFMTLSGTAHPSCTDASLIVPWIMKMVTGTTLNQQVALREYTDATVAFLDYLRTGVKGGVLTSGVTSENGPLGDADKRGKVKGSVGADWEVFVVPEE